MLLGQSQDDVGRLDRGQRRSPHAEAACSAAGTRYQFERIGYFCVDLDSKPGALVFNRTVSLRDTWAKIAART